MILLRGEAEIKETHRLRQNTIGSARSTKGLSKDMLTILDAVMSWPSISPCDLRSGFPVALRRRAARR